MLSFNSPFVSKPQTDQPKVLTPEEEAEQEEEAAAKDERAARARAAGATGRRQTLLTGNTAPQGVRRKTLLGQ